METEQIKNKIQTAVDVVKDVPEPFRMKAFEVVLTSLMKSSGSEIQYGTRSETQPPEGVQTVESKLEKLAKTAGIQVQQLKDIFQFAEKEPVFIGKVAGTEANRQVQISRLLLLAMQEAYGTEWVEGSFLSKALQDYGVGSLPNLARNLGEETADFRAMGQKKGRKYKLTEQGRKTAIESVKQLTAT